MRHAAKPGLAALHGPGGHRGSRGLRSGAPAHQDVQGAAGAAGRRLWRSRGTDAHDRRFTDNEQDIGNDFAATLGTGGVLGTKFTWPDYGPKFKNVNLDARKEAHWKKWIALYNEKMLSKGDFRDLYVYGYDLPEAYAIEKDGSMYYAFYAPEKAAKATKQTADAGTWSGEIELRGLSAKTYKVVDYVNNKDYGTVSGPAAKLKVEIQDSLLLEATPVPGGTSKIAGRPTDT